MIDPITIAFTPWQVALLVTAVDDLLHLEEDCREDNDPHNAPLGFHLGDEAMEQLHLLADKAHMAMDYVLEYQPGPAAGA